MSEKKQGFDPEKLDLVWIHRSKPVFPTPHIVDTPSHILLQDPMGPFPTALTLDNQKSKDKAKNAAKSQVGKETGSPQSHSQNRREPHEEHQSPRGSVHSSIPWSTNFDSFSSQDWLNLSGLTLTALWSAANFPPVVPPAFSRQGRNSMNIPAGISQSGSLPTMVQQHLLPSPTLFPRGPFNGTNQMTLPAPPSIRAIYAIVKF